MFTSSDLKPLALGAGAAAVAGMLLGAWVSPPSNLGEEQTRAEAQMTTGESPDVAGHRSTIATEGAGAEPYALARYAPPAGAEPGARQIETAAFSPAQ